MSFSGASSNISWAWETNTLGFFLIQNPWVSPKREYSSYTVWHFYYRQQPIWVYVVKAPVYQCRAVRRAHHNAHIIRQDLDTGFHQWYVDPQTYALCQYLIQRWPITCLHAPSSEYKPVYLLILGDTIFCPSSSALSARHTMQFRWGISQHADSMVYVWLSHWVLPGMLAVSSHSPSTLWLTAHVSIIILSW